MHCAVNSQCLKYGNYVLCHQQLMPQIWKLCIVSSTVNASNMETMHYAINS